MAHRQVSFFVCDEVLISLNGKYTISGMYTGDIVIPNNGVTLPQFVVMFEIAASIDSLYKQIILQVSIPGEAIPRQSDITALVLPSLKFIPKGRETIMIRYPLLIQSPTLSSGPIEVKLIHELGELLAGRHWVVTIEEAKAYAAIVGGSVKK